MVSRIILTILGSDRPGLTQALADAILAAGGNWLESHLSHLGGKYVGSVLVELDDAHLAALEAAVHKVVGDRLQVAIVPAGQAPAHAGSSLGIEIVGQDRPGIVREVTSVLAALSVNIEDFASATERTAWSGELLFRAHARLTLPNGMNVDRVREALESISGEIMVDLTVSPRR